MGKVIAFLGSLFVRPPAILIGWILSFRRVCYRYHFFKKASYEIPVVTVGNLSLGGTGKTPATIWLARYFTEKGLTPMIITRGYKSRYEKTRGLLFSKDARTADACIFGDEAVVMAQTLTKGAVVVGRNRSANIDYYFGQVEPDVLVLEDGFQHLSIRADVNLVCFDATMPISSYKIFPAGKLREGLSSLVDADALLFTRADLVNEAELETKIKFLLSYCRKDIPVVCARYEVKGLSDGSGTLKMFPGEIRGQKVIAVAGVANPSSFLKNLNDLGADVIQTFFYRDHHHFRARNVKKIMIAAQKKQAIVVSTEKDIVKLRLLKGTEAFLSLGIELKIIREEEKFGKMLSERVGSFIKGVIP